MTDLGIILRQVTKKIDDTKVLLENVNFEFKFGHIYLIKAKSGLGKTTLLTMIGNLEKPTAGVIEYKGINLKAKPFSYLFTDHMNFKDFTGYENLKLVSKDQSKIDSIAEELGILKLLPKKVSTYSKGEYARLAIARIILEDKPIILLDEPTCNLDSENTVKVFNILKRISANKLIICVSHDYVNDELINLTIADKNLKYVDEKKENDVFIEQNEYQQKRFLPFLFIIKFIGLVFKKLPIKSNVFMLMALLIIVMTTIRASLINPEKQLKKLIYEQNIEFVLTDDKIAGYYFYYLKTESSYIPCLYSIDDVFEINGQTYKLKENSIYLNKIYENEDWNLPVQGYVDINKFSLIAKDYIVSEFVNDGLTLDLNNIPIIEKQLKDDYLDIFDFKIRSKENSSLQNNEIILHCSQMYYEDILFSLIMLKNQEIEINKLSPIYSIYKNLKIVDIVLDEEVDELKIDIEGSKELISAIENKFPLIYNALTDNPTYLSNASYEDINLFDFYTNNDLIDEQIYFLGQIKWLIIALDLLIVVILAIFIVLSVFLISAITTAFCNEFNLIKILGYSKINSIFISCFGLIFCVILSYFIGLGLTNFLLPILTIEISKFYSTQSYGYSLLTFSYPYVIFIIMILEIIVISVIFSKRNKNFNTVLKENRI